MRTIILFVCAVFILSSCGNTYYYAQMKSNDPYMEKDSTGNFIIDSDSLRITYSFYGENAPVKISVRNKMVQDLYIDWGQSYFIFGDNDENRLNISEYMKPWEVLQLVGSKSESVKSLFELSNLKFEKIKSKFYTDKKIKGTDGKQIKLKSIYYTEENTPLYMRNTLALHIGKVGDNAVLFNQDFYIANLTKSHNLSPQKLAAYANKRGDSFYTKNERGKGFKKFLQVTGDILIITGEVLEVVLSNSFE